MDWQLAATLSAIMFASAYFAWRAYRAWQSSKAGGCGGGCGCAKSDEPKTAAIIPVQQLTMRLKHRSGR